MSASDDGVSPGTPVEPSRAAPIIQKFLKAFRTHEPDGIPTDCPTVNCVEPAYLTDDRVLERAPVPRGHRLFVVIEMGYRVFECDVRSIRHSYLEDRLPGDGDWCIFDDSCRWAIFLTHNDDWYLSDPHDLFPEGDQAP